MQGFELRVGLCETDAGLADVNRLDVVPEDELVRQAPAENADELFEGLGEADAAQQTLDRKSVV